MLGDALTADPADLLRARVRASAYQVADEPPTLQRTREEREGRSLRNATGAIQGHKRRMDDENVSGKTHRRGTGRVFDNSNKEKVTLQLVVNTVDIQIMTAVPLEYKIFRTPVDLERDFAKWMRRELHMDMDNPYSPAIGLFRRQLTNCPNTNSQVPDSPEYNGVIAEIADCAVKLLRVAHVKEADSWR